MKEGISRCPWLKPVVLATKETKIRRIVIQSYSGQVVWKPYFKNIQHKNSWWFGSSGEVPAP
jgi:hypothetical protein